MTDTRFASSRLLGDDPHLDGYFISAPEDLAKDSANLVLTRNGLDDWSLNRTAAGAETYNVRTTLEQILRSGETEDLGIIAPAGAALPDKGLKVVDFFLVYQIGVVNLTTATLRLGKAQFPAVVSTPTAIVQSNIVAATAIATAFSAVGPRTEKVAVPAGSQVFHKNDLSQIGVEAVLVMANTGTLRVYGIGAHVYHNYH